MLSLKTFPFEEIVTHPFYRTLNATQAGALFNIVSSLWATSLPFDSKEPSLANLAGCTGYEWRYNRFIVTRALNAMVPMLQKCREKSHKKKDVIERRLTLMNEKLQEMRKSLKAKAIKNLEDHINEQMTQPQKAPIHIDQDSNHISRRYLKNKPKSGASFGLSDGGGAQS